jgi:hypothetical protein
MSCFHCSCGFAVDEAESFGDHLGWVFDRDDDMGTDGNRHAEIVGRNLARHLCACGFASPDAQEFNDHLLLIVIAPDAIGLDGNRHVPVDTSTALSWYVRRSIDE